MKECSSETVAMPPIVDKSSAVIPPSIFSPFSLDRRLPNFNEVCCTYIYHDSRVAPQQAERSDSGSGGEREREECVKNISSKAFLAIFKNKIK